MEWNKNSQEFELLQVEEMYVSNTVSDYECNETFG